MAMPTISRVRDFFSDKAEDGEIVFKRAGGGDHLDVVGMEGFDAVGHIFKELGLGEVVKANEQGCAGAFDDGAKGGKVGLLKGFGGFDLKVDQSAPGLRRLTQNGEFLGD